VAKLIPDTLFGRLALLLFVAVLASHGLTLTLLFEVMGPPPDGGGAAHHPPGPPPLLALGLWLDIAVRISALMIAAWIGARWLSRPMQQWADAARDLGNNINGPALKVSGTLECRQATQVFNQMQAQIQRQLQEKGSLVAAVSHDLRTPLTRMALRAESLADEKLRARFTSDIAEMNAMIAATLGYLQGSATLESWVLVDVHALLGSIVDDYQDNGKPVVLAPCADGTLIAPLFTQVGALRRCICNLVDNAVRYGGEARVRLICSPGTTTIQVSDSGPGIPESELSNVLQPFYRLEHSRNRDSGGVGLGLAIVSDFANRMSASLTLKNAQGGGLVASLDLSH
jgi:protein-histidine pros-kinase